MNVEESIKWLEKAQVILARQAQEESKIAGKSERNEILQYHMAIQCILEEYEKQQDIINKAVKYMKSIKHNADADMYCELGDYDEYHELFKILKGEQ